MKPTATPQSVIEKKKKYLIPCAYHFYKNPPLMVRGEGPYLIDSEGKRYLDHFIAAYRLTPWATVIPR